MLEPLNPATTAVVLNPGAQGGRAEGKWHKLIDSGHERFREARKLPVFRPSASSREELEARISDWIRLQAAAGRRNFIAAGGDGTVHALLNALLASQPEGRWREFAVGAIGLGSSNDFHKDPSRSATKVAGVSVRCDFSAASPHDIGCVEFEERPEPRFFIVNASIGLTAAGNRNFNDPSRLIRFCKKTHTGTAMALTALSTLLRYQAVPVSLRAAGASFEAMQLANAGLIMRIPHFSGDLSYPFCRPSAGGGFYLYLCRDMGRWEMLRTMARLAAGKFVPGRRQLIIESPFIDLRAFGQPVWAELDGEVLATRGFRAATKTGAVMIAG